MGLPEKNGHIGVAEKFENLPIKKIKDKVTYVCVKLLGRIYTQGRDPYDMILVGMTSSFGDTV